MKKKTKEEALEIIDILGSTYPDADCELKFGNNLQLLIAVMLSAQTTDKSVNAVMKDIFVEHKTVDDFLAMSEEGLREKIKRIGLYKTKSKNLYKTLIILKEEHGGIVPKAYDALIKLPGVGRKTANVVQSVGFGVPAIAVDTHVFRVSNRIGLAKAEKVEKTEEQLMRLIPKDMWTKTHHILIFHGRNICNARKPKCDDCPIVTYCNHPQMPIV